MSRAIRRLAAVALPSTERVRSLIRERSKFCRLNPKLVS
jgi:hypothetical protein